MTMGSFMANRNGCSNHLATDWPHDWQGIAQANDEHPPMTLRVNVQKNSVNDYLKRLNDAGMEACPHSVASEGITLVSPCDVYVLPGFTEGCVSVQDGAAQLAVSLLDLHRVSECLMHVALQGKTCIFLEDQLILLTVLHWMWILTFKKGQRKFGTASFKHHIASG